jgi:protein involved in polysaccharide export with SLBB domain
MRGPTATHFGSAALLVAALLAGTPDPGAAQAPDGGAKASTFADRPQPGDVVRLRVWREPELSGEFPIDETGEVVLPRIGPLNVADETPASLKARIVGELERFLTHSSIDVDLLRRIQVLGAVRNPGLYPVDATMSISDVLALAGGATSEGEPEKVELVREGKRIEGRLTMDAQMASTAIRSGDQLIVPQRSWLARNTGIVAAGMTASVSLIIALFTR